MLCIAILSTVGLLFATIGGAHQHKDWVTEFTWLGGYFLNFYDSITPGRAIQNVDHLLFGAARYLSVLIGAMFAILLVTGRSRRPRTPPESAAAPPPARRRSP
jgi:hypothetical protein